MIVSCASAVQHYTAVTDTPRARQPVGSVQHWSNLPDSVQICGVCGFYKIYKIYDNPMEIMNAYGQKSGFADEWPQAVHNLLSIRSQPSARDRMLNIM